MYLQTVSIDGKIFFHSDVSEAYVFENSTDAHIVSRLLHQIDDRFNYPVDNLYETDDIFNFIIKVAPIII